MYNIFHAFFTFKMIMFNFMHMHIDKGCVYAEYMWQFITGQAGNWNRSLSTAIDAIYGSEVKSVPSFSLLFHLQFLTHLI